MKSELPVLTISVLLAACFAIPHHNEQAKAPLGGDTALYQKQDCQHATPYPE